MTCFWALPPLAILLSTSCLDNVTEVTPPSNDERHWSLTSSVSDRPCTVATSCTPRCEIVLAASHSDSLEISSTTTLSGARFSTALRMYECWFEGLSTGTQRADSPMAGCGSLDAPAISLVLSTTTTTRLSWSDNNLENSRSTVVLPEFGGPTRRIDDEQRLNDSGNIRSTVPSTVRPTRTMTPIRSFCRPLMPLTRCKVPGKP
mmetsp:Transcript_62348/g.190575  ORF Transcript_62348/g.190575 Transcript_62348/m.190575 type:complete len:204 (+) Transcript_62348:267-878(+)